MAALRIEIVYGNAEKQSVIELSVPPGTSAREAILHSNILNAWPEIQLEACKIGVFGKLVTLDYQLCDQDRLEIYRPLIVDPKKARKLRVKS
jgi:putative ubiquitin-RnfH superfamily antitoxin RatB of RatAB toxin-antitoxin module